MAHVSHWYCADCDVAWPGTKQCQRCGSKKGLKRLPSVTTVLNPIKIGGIEGLLHWAWGLGIEGRDLREARQAAADVGSVAHAGVEADIRGEPFSLDELPIFGEQRERVIRCLAAWGEWRDQTKLQMVGCEVALSSAKNRYGGTLDIASVYSKRGIIDIKTGGTYPEHLVQVRAYGELWNEAHPTQQIEEYHLIRLGKEDGSFHHHRWDASVLHPAWTLFLSALRVYQDAAKLKKIAA